MDPTMNAGIRAKSYAALGLELPEEASRLLAIIQASNAAVYADPMAGIDYDKLTPTNAAKVLREAALTRAVKAGMQEIAVDVQRQIGRRINGVFAADLDRVVEALRPRYLESAAVVTDAITSGLTRDVYGNSGKVLNAGPDAAGLYHRTRDALAYLDQVRAFLHDGRADVTTVVTLTDRAHADTLDSARQIISGTGGNERFLELYALPGIAPALNTADQADAVLRRSAELRQADADVRKAAEIEAARQRNATWERFAALAAR